MEKITIDKTIEIFEGIKKGICPWYPEPYYDKAITTMRKYQKIEQILDDRINDDSVGMSDYWMGKIKEVINDGGSEEP